MPEQICEPHSDLACAAAAPQVVNFASQRGAQLLAVAPEAPEDEVAPAGAGSEDVELLHAAIPRTQVATAKTRACEPNEKRAAVEP